MSELAQKQTMIKPSPIIQMSNTLSTLEHKLYNGLLYIARERLKDQRLRTLFHVEFSQLKDLLKFEYESNAHLKQNLKKLATTTVEYNILGKDTEEWGIFALVSLVKFKTTKNNCIITFQLPEPIVQALLENKLYAKLQLKIIRGIKSKYALILYELVKDYERAQVPEMTIEEFRKIFGLVGKYKNFAELRRNVLDPAIEELNTNENIDFVVSYKLKRKGNRYTHIKFVARKRPKKLTAYEKWERGTKELEKKDQKLYNMICACVYTMEQNIEEKYIVAVRKKYTQILLDTLIQLLEEYGLKLVVAAIDEIKRRDSLKYVEMKSAEFVVALRAQCKKLSQLWGQK